jgi:tetratricopeptide (TPR) repeat protein
MIINNQQILKNKIAKLVNHYNGNNYGYVIRECGFLLKKIPNNAFIQNLLGSCFQKIGDLNQAKKIFLHILKKEKNNIPAMNNLANTYKGLKEYDNAEKYYNNILEINPNYINALVNYGSLSFELDKHEKALELYDKALKLDKNNLLLYYNTALAHQSLGNFEKAEFCLNEVLRIDPKITAADKFLSRLTNYKKNNTHLLEMEKKLLSIPLNESEKTNLFFALGKAYEDLKNYEKSFFYLKKGNHIKKKLTKYTSELDDNFFIELHKFFDDYDFSKITNPRISPKSIIFILGMPRSGTSLVEQIISSHSQVYGCGELSYLEDLITKNFITNNNFNADVLKGENSRNIIDEISNEYLTRLKPLNISKEFCTDKAPLNFKWIGFIKLLFPNAKIIHCVREPKDNCLSLYKNIFDENLNWTYDQSDLAKFYLNYSKIMKFWNTKFPDFIHNIKYENLITNPSNEVKKLIKFCGLTWEENCLKFYNNKKSIKTVSSIQARQQLYSTSISSSENYKTYLTDLFSDLEIL